MFNTLPLIAAVTGTFLLAGFVKGVSGLGLPTIGIGLLSLAMPPAEAAALIVVPSLVTNVWQLARGSALGPLVRRLWPMMIGIGLGTWAGTIWLAGVGSERALAVLGATLALYAAVGLSPVRLPQVSAQAEPWLGPVTGALTGMVTSATGVFVIPAVPYLQALGLDREDLVQALGLSFTMSTVALALSLAGAGDFGAHLGAASLLALIPALLGMEIGQRIRRSIDPLLFRRCFFGGVLLLGGHLLLRGGLR